MEGNLLSDSTTLQSFAVPELLWTEIQEKMLQVLWKRDFWSNFMLGGMMLSFTQ